MQNTDPSQHSPWELFDEGMSAEEMRAEAPSLDMQERQRLQAALKQLMQARKYQLFCKTPGPDAVYATGDEGMAGCIYSLVVMPALNAQKKVSSLMVSTDLPKLCHSCCLLGSLSNYKAQSSGGGGGGALSLLYCFMAKQLPFRGHAPCKIHVLC